MIEKRTIFRDVKSKIKLNLIIPELFKDVIEALEKAVETKEPILLSGDQGIGKTFGTMYFAYRYKYEIVMINASSELRLKENSKILQSLVLTPSPIIKLVVIDEIEKGSGLSRIRKAVAINQKSAFKTNVIIIGITNHYWQLGKLTEQFGAFHYDIKAPYVRSIRKHIRERGIKYSGPIIRDLRFVENILLNPTADKIPGISDNTFEAIGNFLSSDYKERNIYETINNLNAPFWKWIIANFHHGTFMFEVKRKDGIPKNIIARHNTAMYFKAVELLSKADMYHQNKMLTYVVPKLKKPYIQHPSSLAKRKYGDKE